MLIGYQPHLTIVKLFMMLAAYTQEILKSLKSQNYESFSKISSKQSLFLVILLKYQVYELPQTMFDLSLEIKNLANRDCQC